MALRKQRFYFLSFIFLFIISACQGGQSISTLEDPVPSQVRSSSSNGIEFELTNIEFETSPSSITTTIRNTTYNSCSYGDFFHVEVERKGLWYRVNYPDNVFEKFPNFIDIGYILEPNDTVTQTFSLERLNMILPQGQYRLSKTVLCASPQGSEITLAVPFKVKN